MFGWGTLGRYDENVSKWAKNVTNRHKQLFWKPQKFVIFLKTTLTNRRLWAKILKCAPYWLKTCPTDPVVVRKVQKKKKKRGITPTDRATFCPLPLHGFQNFRSLRSFTPCYDPRAERPNRQSPKGFCTIGTEQHFKKKKKLKKTKWRILTLKNFFLSKKLIQLWGRDYLCRKGTLRQRVFWQQMIVLGKTQKNPKKRYKIPIAKNPLAKKYQSPIANRQLPNRFWVASKFWALGSQQGFTLDRTVLPRVGPFLGQFELWLFFNQMVFLEKKTLLLESLCKN